MAVNLPAKNTDLANTPKLDLVSLRQLEFKLRLDRDYLIALATRAGAHYHPFIKPAKTLPFQKYSPIQKKRIIDNPNDQMRYVQKRIYRRLLRQEQLPDYVYGGIVHKSIVDNVNRHLGATVLVTVDIASFFPSVTNEYVYWLWNYVLGCSSGISQLLTKLTSFERHLPQGAATSTPLANILVCAIDKQIRLECEKWGIVYTTWIDDFAFSGSDPRLIIAVVIRALRKAGLRISRKKIKIMGPATRKLLNGILVGKQLGVPKEVRSRIRSGIHKLAIGAVPIQTQTRYVKSLVARIRQAERINPRQIRSLRFKLITLLNDSSIAIAQRQHFRKQLGCI